MKTFTEYFNLREADYCAGLSLNADMFWDKSKDVSFLTIGNKNFLVNSVLDGVKASKMNLVDQRVTSYGADPNFGFSFLAVLGQSHVMIHTWPESHMMNIDVFTCGNEGSPHVLLQHIQNAIKPDHIQIGQNQRGIRKDIENAREKPDTPKDLKPVSMGTSLSNLNHN